MDTKEILMKHVCPALGDGIALVMFLSPLPAVLRVNRDKSLGDLNALPFAAMAINCAAWIFYALLLKDFYIYVGNMPGLLMGLFYTMTCYKFSKEAAQDVLRSVLIAGCALYWLLGLASMAASLDAAATKTLWGAACVSVLGVYYTAPLTSVAKVLLERDSSSLHAPLSVMNVVNGMLWFTYGLALRDWFIALPNGIGAGFNVVCVVLCFVFPARRRQQQQALRQQQQQEGRQQQPPGAALGSLDPGANWGALRVQSIARRPGEAPPVSSGGFFDLAQMRWRSGRLGSLLRSFGSATSAGSGRRLGSVRRGAPLPAGKDAGDAADGAGAPGGDDVLKVVITGDESSGGDDTQSEPRIKAGPAAAGGAAAADPAAPPSQPRRPSLDAPGRA